MCAVVHSSITAAMRSPPVNPPAAPTIRPPAASLIPSLSQSVGPSPPTVPTSAPSTGVPTSVSTMRVTAPGLIAAVPQPSALAPAHGNAPPPAAATATQLAPPSGQQGATRPALHSDAVSSGAPSQQFGLTAPSQPGSTAHPMGQPPGQVQGQLPTASTALGPNRLAPAVPTPPNAPSLSQAIPAAQIAASQPPVAGPIGVTAAASQLQASTIQHQQGVLQPVIAGQAQPSIAGAVPAPAAASQQPCTAGVSSGQLQTTLAGAAPRPAAPPQQQQFAAGAQLLAAAGLAPALGASLTQQGLALMGQRAAGGGQTEVPDEAWQLASDVLAAGGTSTTVAAVSTAAQQVPFLVNDFYSVKATVILCML